MRKLSPTCFQKRPHSWSKTLTSHLMHRRASGSTSSPIRKSSQFYIVLFSIFHIIAQPCCDGERTKLICSRACLASTTAFSIILFLIHVPGLCHTTTYLASFWMILSQAHSGVLRAGSKAKAQRESRARVPLISSTSEHDNQPVRYWNKTESCKLPPCVFYSLRMHRFVWSLVRLDFVIFPSTIVCLP